MSQTVAHPTNLNTVKGQRFEFDANGITIRTPVLPDWCTAGIESGLSRGFKFLLQGKPVRRIFARDPLREAGRCQRAILGRLEKGERY
jgi:hypothetical protein